MTDTPITPIDTAQADRLIDAVFAHVDESRQARLGFCPKTRSEVAAYLATRPDEGHAARTFAWTVTFHGDHDTARQVWTWGQLDEYEAADRAALARRIVEGIVR